LVTSVNLGSFFKSGDKYVFGGGSSGLDTETLVNGLVEARSVGKVKIEDKITLNTEINTAFSELDTLLASFQLNLNTLRNPPGFSNSSSDIFEYRTATTSINNGGTASSYATVTAGVGAPVGNFKLKINQLAQEKVTVYSTAFASRNTAIVEASGGTTAGTISAGTISLGTTTLGPVNVAIAENDSLNDVVAKINLVKAQTGVEASVLKVSDTDFRLVMKSTSSGLDNSFTMTDGGGVFSELTVDPLASKVALNSQFTVDGVPIERSSNQVTDAIESVTMNLTQLTGLAEITVTVTPDRTSTRTAIENFVNSYNEIKVFAAKQTLREEGGAAAEDAKLVNNNTLNAIMNRIDNELTSLVGGITTGPNSIQALGIKFTDYEGDAENPPIRNVLEIDNETFDEALNGDYDQFKRVFQFTFESDSEDLAIFARTNALSVNNFDLEFDFTTDPLNPTVFAKDIVSGAILDQLDYSSGIVKGRTGTSFEGLEMLYSGSTLANQTIRVGITQGVADRLYNAVSGVTDETEGLLTLEVESRTDENTRLQEEIVDIDAEIERYRQTLLEQFSRLETAIAQVNQLLSALDAQDQSRYAAG
jgi:flagellar hook-associated protein 2